MSGRSLLLPANKELVGSRRLDNNFPQDDLRVGIQCVESVSNENSRAEIKW